MLCSKVKILFNIFMVTVIHVLWFCCSFYSLRQVMYVTHHQYHLKHRGRDVRRSETDRDRDRQRKTEMEQDRERQRQRTRKQTYTYKTKIRNRCSGFLINTWRQWYIFSTLRFRYSEYVEQ